jgi:CheY-like chemotaxis protein
MLPPRAYAEPLAPFSANLRAHTAPTETRPPLVVVVAPEDVERYPALPFTRYAARTTTEAVRLIERWRPRLIAVDWGLEKLDAGAVCAAAKQISPVGVLAVMESPERAPAALKAGCHAILLKPFPLNLVAARLGRLSREMPVAAAAVRLGASQAWGTNRCPLSALQQRRRRLLRLLEPPAFLVRVRRLRERVVGSETGIRQIPNPKTQTGIPSDKIRDAIRPFRHGQRATP